MVIDLIQKAKTEMDFYVDNTRLDKIDISLAEEICLIDDLSAQEVVKLYNKFTKLTK